MDEVWDILRVVLNICGLKRGFPPYAWDYLVDDINRMGTVLRADLALSILHMFQALFECLVSERCCKLCMGREP